MIKFNSQICTTKEQSERLLKLGLNPETADCCLYPLITNPNQYLIMDRGIQPFDTDETPAWSLHRLIGMLPQEIHLDNYVDTCYYLTIKPFCLTKVLYRQDGGCWLYGSESSNLFDAIIDVIEKVINGIYFNKEYLKEK